jgi:hypothetical protein
MGDAVQEFSLFRFMKYLSSGNRGGKREATGSGQTEASIVRYGYYPLISTRAP